MSRTTVFFHKSSHSTWTLLYTANFLATKEDLSPLLRPAATHRGALSRLLRLHLAAELAILLQGHLSSSAAGGGECLRGVVQRALRDAAKEVEEEEMAFEEGDDLIWERKRRKEFVYEIQGSQIKEDLAK